MVVSRRESITSIRSIWLWIIVILTLLGAALRLHALGSSPLRGDEAFAVRYWAAPLNDLLDPANGIAWKEPHPFGTFLLFGAWRAVAGDTEFALRLLPAMINLLGVPAIFVVGARLLHDARLAAFASLLWAINPHLIWHSQDFRNYAIWAPLSLISVLMLLRLTDSNTLSRQRWLAYISVVTLTLYLFFFEVTLLPVHGLYLALFQRRQLRAWLGTMLIVFALSLPSVYQIVRIAQNGYGGSGGGAELRSLIWVFPSQLLFGETGTISIVPLLLCLPGLIILWQRQRSAAGLLLLWLVLPAVSLLLISTRMNIFWARYLIASTPALLLAISGSATLIPIAAPLIGWRSALRMAFVAVMIVLILTVQALGVYYSPDYHKAPDWFGLRDYLSAVVEADDLVIMSSLDPLTGNADPAFEWYYRSAAPVLTLPNPQIEILPAIEQALNQHRAVWYVISGDDPRINDTLLAQGALISDDSTGRSFLVRQYRERSIRAMEIEYPLDPQVEIGGATLQGYALSGRAISGGKLTVLLYWTGTADPALTAFVHLIGQPKADGSPLWTQKDHPPIAPGRDVYTLNLAEVPAGEYQLVLGMYDPANDNRRIQIGASDHLLLTTITIQ